MVSFCAVFIVFLQYSSGIFIFKKPEITNFFATWVAGLIALLAVCLVLWNIPLYPKKLRKLIPIGSCLYDYLASTFLVEYYMANFWFPLEAAVMSIPKTIAQIVEIITLVDDNSNLKYLDIVLKQECIEIIVDYFLSLTTLILAMHATRMIDLSLLKQGLKPFLCDARKNFERFLKYTLFPSFPSIPCMRGRKGRQDDEDEDGEDDDLDRAERKSVEFKEDFGGDDDKCLDLPQMPTKEYYNIFRRR